MALELLVLIAMTLFFFGGLVGPIVGWVVWMGARRRRLIEGLRLSGLDDIEELGAEDAETPATLRLRVAGRAVTLRAQLRGDVRVWVLAIPVGSGLDRWALVREGRARVFRQVRELRPTPLEHLPPTIGLRAAAPLDDVFARQLEVAAGKLVSARDRVLQVAHIDGELVFEVERSELSSKQLVRVLRAAFGFAVALGVIDEAPLRSAGRGAPHELVAAPGSGAPIASPA
jgi:hypothetical protein